MDKPVIRQVLHDIINECQPEGHQDIRIKCLTRGYQVGIGCGTFAFEKLGDMIEALNLFLDDQQDAEKAFNEHMREFVGVDEPPSAPECPPTINQDTLRDVIEGAVRVGYPETQDETPG